MIDEPDDDDDEDQFTIDDFRRTNKRGRTWQCRTCGYESETKELVDNCHPEERLKRERQAEVTDTTDSHTGFVYPPQLYPTVRELLTDVDAAIQATDQSDVLRTASDVIAEHLSGNPFQSRAFQVFTYLVFLQQCQVLPGYPASVPTRAETSIGIQEFCRMTDQFRGDVTDEMIKTSDLIQTERVYRAKVYSTTEDFAHQSELLPNWSRWQWTTQRTVAEKEFLTNVVFDEGTAHNAVVVRTRDWLATHPEIDWACAPHVMGMSGGEQTESRFSLRSSSSDPPEGPVMMFDFAGFTDQHHLRLAVAGVVIGDEPPLEIQEQLSRASHIDVPVMAVFPTRQAITGYIATADAQDWFPDDAAPIDDVAEYYSRQPSIPAINEEFSKHALGKNTLRFVSRKQLIDDVVDPVSVLPEPALRGDE